MRKACGVVFFLVALLLGGVANAQVSTSGTLVGTVQDTSGAVIGGADVKVTDEATGAVLTTKSATDGTFSVANLRPGNYTVTITFSGFKTAEYRAVKISVGQTTDLQAKMAVGEISTSVVVEAGQEVLQTQQTTVGSTVTGKLITSIPFTSRDTLDLAVLDAGAQTTGAPRGTTFNGLPQGAINITLDGINVQANDSKSSDGFFTLVRPRIDTIEEFSISTAAQGADQAGEGAVQIRFETRRGGNQFHGGAWWYHRNDFFNSNYYFNNQGGIPRQRLRLNQFGYKIGGPIWKEKLFFFHAFDFYRNPQGQNQTRTILAPAAETGLFDYRTESAVGLSAANPMPAWLDCGAGFGPGTSSGSVPAQTLCRANLMALATARGQSGVLDSLVASYVAAVRSSVSVPGVGILPIASPYQQRITFNSNEQNQRYFPDVRFDYNLSKNHSLTAIYHYQDFNASPDLLNNFGPSYLAAPFDSITAGQFSTRNSMSFGWRWNLASNKSNELRVGGLSSPTNFRGDQDISNYPIVNTAFGPLKVRPCFASNAACNQNEVMSQPFRGYSPFTENFALGQLTDNLGWTSGKHNMNFGFSLTEQRGGTENRNAAVGRVNIAMVNDDPARTIFGTNTLLGVSAADITNARNLYAFLNGRVAGFTSTIFVNNDTRQFTPGANRTDRMRQREMGFYGTDSWRLTNNLTLNYGLRWEYQGVPSDPDNLFYQMQGGVNAVYGVSGAGNLFQPGTLTGAVPTYELTSDPFYYNTDLNNFAPSFGVAYQPGFENRFWKMLFGEPGKTVLRGSYAITYTREGLNNWDAIAQANPGSAANLIASPVAPPAAGVILPAGQFAAGSVSLASLTMPGVGQTPNVAFGTPFVIDANASHAVNVFSPNLRTPYVQSWTFGIQRELSSSTALEVRYVANHGTGLLRQIDINEINIFENGFLNEFNNAQNNLAICRANVNACLSAAGQPLTLPNGQPNPARFFSNVGLPGQVAVPILTAAFSTTGSQTNASFSSSANISFLDQGTAGAFANALATSSSQWQNLTGCSIANAAAPCTGPFPANFWRVNPHATGGAFLMTNGSHSTYNALQVEVRRRPARGLQFNSNYTWSHSLTNLFADSSSSFNGFTTMRNPGFNKGPSPFDLRHTFKTQLIYELPFGAGKAFSSSHGWINRMIEGWELSTITRWQTGRVFRVDSGNGGTVNQNDPGVELVGITREQIQDMLEVRKLPDGRVFWFPASLLDASQARSNTAFIRPCATPGQLCQRLFLNGPSFFRADWSVIKKTRITETSNIEFRAEFLNAFNNINFFYGGSAGTSIPTRSSRSDQFGQLLSAYQDVSTTDDPGGRIIQMVIRINF